MAAMVSSQPKAFRISKFGIMKMKAGRNSVAMMMPNSARLNGNCIRASA